MLVRAEGKNLFAWSVSFVRAVEDYIISLCIISAEKRGPAVEGEDRGPARNVLKETQVDAFLG